MLRIRTNRRSGPDRFARSSDRSRRAHCRSPARSARPPSRRWRPCARASRSVRSRSPHRRGPDAEPGRDPAGARRGTAGDRPHRRPIGRSNGVGARRPAIDAVGGERQRGVATDDQRVGRPVEDALGLPVAGEDQDAVVVGDQRGPVSPECQRARALRQPRRRRSKVAARTGPSASNVAGASEEEALVPRPPRHRSPRRGAGRGRRGRRAGSRLHCRERSRTTSRSRAPAPPLCARARGMTPASGCGRGRRLNPRPSSARASSASGVLSSASGRPAARSTSSASGAPIGGAPFGLRRRREPAQRPSVCPSPSKVSTSPPPARTNGRRRRRCGRPGGSCWPGRVESVGARRQTRGQDREGDGAAERRRAWFARLAERPMRRGLRANARPLRAAPAGHDAPGCGDMLYDRRCRRRFWTARRSRRASGRSSRARSRGLAARGVEPGLAVVLVGEDPASQIYVRNKTAASAQVGIRTFDHRLPATTSQARAAGAGRASLNADPAVDGILIQLPLPGRRSTRARFSPPSIPARTSTAFTPTTSATW